MCVSPDKRDFIGPIRKLPKGANIQGISNNLKIEGSGTVLWSVLDTNGNLRNLKLPCYYIPKLHQRLLSTTVFSKSYPDSTISATAKAWTITQNGQTIDIYINPRNNLPTSTCFRKSAVSSIAANLGETVVSMANQNLSEPQKESLRWHHRLGHVGQSNS